MVTFKLQIQKIINVGVQMSSLASIIKLKTKHVEVISGGAQSEASGGYKKFVI